VIRALFGTYDPFEPVKVKQVTGFMEGVHGDTDEVGE
jgi:hypothetical protein